MEEKSEGRRKPQPWLRYENLGDIVLSWSLDQILDEGLFKNQMEKLPSTFNSVGHYLESFAVPLMEETRSDLCSSLSDISNAPCSRITSKEKGNKKRHLETTLEYFIDVEFFKNCVDGSNKSYKARNGDLFILSNIELQAVEDLYRHSVTYCFALVTEVGVDEGITKGFATNIPKGSVLEDGISSFSFACFVTNLLTYIRIWKVLVHTPGTNNNFRIIQEVLSPKPMMTLRDSPYISEKVDNLLTNLTNNFSLNQSQINAVRTVIHATRGTESNSVELIWGPPGTGKTKTVTAMLWLFLHMQCRTLICAPTNVAVVGVCCRFIQLVKEIRMHNSQHELPFSLSNILLFGNRDRMEMYDELQDVFLDYRVDQLLVCLSPLTGWRHRISSAIQLFEDCTSTFEMFVENRQEECWQMEEYFNFSEFLRKQFVAVIDPVKDCITNLWIHTNCISSQNASKILVLLGLLEKMNTLIFNVDLDDVKLREVFSQDIANPIVLHDTVSSEHGFSIIKELLEARVKVVNLLKHLQRTLSLPDTIDKNFIRNFCIRNATVIFCTVSSSSMLHYLDMDPLQILVIDEAAQLKECESIIPLRLNGMRCAVLVGDEYQLPAMVKSQTCKDAGFGVSLFERLASVEQRKHLLNMQYRMHPHISRFPNFRFYRKQIQDGPNVLDVNYNRNFEDLLYGPFAFVNVADGREEMDDKSNSRRNMVEVAVVCFLVQILYKHYKSFSQLLSIGVISPYAYQVKAIKDKLGSRYESEDGFDVRVNSVDGFQGEENDVIIFSTVRSNSKGNIGFLHDLQRTNVALTRARHCLWIVGNANTLACSGTIWENIVNDAVARCCFFSVKDNGNLAKVILHVKHELDQLDDLLRSDSVFLSTAIWKVLFSEDFKISFSKLRQIQCKMQVIKLLENLAEGWRSKMRFEEFSGSFELIRINKVNDFFVIWTVDITKDDRYIQVLKVWDILPLEKIERLVSRLDHIFSLYTETYVNYCKKTCTQGKLEVPMSWNAARDIVCYKALGKGESTKEEVSGDMDLLMGMENSKVSESLVLMKFYSLSFGVARHMLTASDGTELDIPFELTDQEKEIIRFPLSTFILGRSGTGKTTILTMKLIQKEQVFSISLDGPSDNAGSSMAAETSVPSISERNFLKQVFITVSPKLCSAIRSHARRLQSFASGVEVLSAASSHCMHDNNELSDFHGIPDTVCNLQRQHFPLVITFRKFLLMLDGTMSRSFFDKYYSQWGVSPDQNGGPKSFALQALMQSKEVNYEKFFGSYWPHFNEQLTKMVDPSIVFTQIISHIKGGLQSGMVHTSRLSREEYLLLSEKRFSTLSRQSREIIYEIFIDYENQKLLASEYDLTDFTNYLHHQLSCDGYVGDKIDFVYIDEVQDLTMRQIALLKYVCRNFKEGYTFAGDTAQTIARGIDFRFEDIRFLFYTEFLSELRSRQPQKETETHMSDMFHLNQNFRTHAGILSLAQSIMVILYYYFPQSVDKLNPEFSLVYGEAPVLLESDNDENVILTIFGNSGGSMLSNSNGFGAEQCILVRDGETKEQICNLVGKQALVLTILECKGLEFQDVLLYNFFGTSPLKKKWRVIYEYMEKHSILDPSIARAFASFGLEKHNLLCSELKQLYVAITRTKQRLWICENADEYCKPMFDYWKKLGLVQVRHLDASIAQAMKSSSSAEDWRTRGIKLFNEGNFELATMCFEKAGDEFNEKWAKAAGLVANAELIISTNFDMAEIALKNAAEIYDSISKPESAAACYIKLKDFKSAGNIYIEKCGMSRLKEAGDCFAMAKCWTLAADAYAAGKFFSDCLSVCSRGKIYDTGLQKLQQWKGGSLSNEQLLKLNNLIFPFLENCLQHYLDLGDIQKVLMYVKTFRLNDTHEQLLSLIRKSLSKNSLDNLLLIEQELGNYLEAAAIAKSMGNILVEVEMLEKAKYFEEAARLLLFHVLVRSLWSPNSNGWPLKGFAEKEELLMKAKELSKHMAGSFEEFVDLEASILSDGSKSLVDMSKHLAQAQKHESLRQEVFIARTVLDAHINANPHKFSSQVSFSNCEKLACDNMSQNHLTLETMMYTWNLWKGMIVNLLCYLQQLNETREYCCRYKEFYLEYFGVRNIDNNRYAVQNPEANWIKGKHLLQKENNVIFITTDECESCALFYWRAELFTVGMKVLDSLESLHSSYNSKQAYLFGRAKVAISMYEIAKFLMTSDLTMTSRSTLKTERYLSLSQRYYLETVTLLDWKNDTMENVKLLRENEIALEIIDASFRDNLKPCNGNLSHGQIGRLVVLLLITGKLPDELFKEIRECLRNKQHWNNFIEQYKTFLDQGFGRIPLLSKFKVALENTFHDPNWGKEKDYVSPHHFISLMEKLMFLASLCQGFNGNVFTTKYSLLEMLKCQGCSGFMMTCLPAISADLRSSVQSTLDFIWTTARHILNDRKQLLSWISNSNMSRESHSILTLRLVILLFIGCLNSGRPIHQMKFVFQNKLSSYLPRPFSERLMTVNNGRHIEVFAEALVSVENPLVIILSQGCRSLFSNLNALTIDSEDIKCHQKVCSLLFPEKQPISHSSNTTKQDINSIPSSNPEESENRDEVIDNQSERLPIKESSSEIDSSNAICQDINSIASEKPDESILGYDIMDKQSVEGEKDVYVELTEECKHFWQKTKEFLSGEHDDVEDTISLLGTVLRWIQQKAETDEFDEHLITEMVDMHERIKLLASVISEGTQVGRPAKDDLLAKWIGLRASFEPLLETLFLHSQSTTEEARPSDNNSLSDENNSDCDPNIHVGVAEVEAEAKSESSSTNQTKASKHQKKKAQRKKGMGKGKKKR
ncbi:uncharacterized protein LOC121971003 [Zingiber officinale]|uniref:UvrD-like helicase ATP-binding domain-containing protein n=1 Tax=Zingiber officinale TaxID=94328 RepID=A0A8J5LHI8_ZINOF|nr:uncharacterized protein LOC121971003 [Zingiber officinale]KAG6515462.1 hypothetical protein ZIOFF_025874 [Zingiber officinale]